MIDNLRTMVPASARGTLHAASGPLVVVLVAYGLANDSQAAAIVAAIVAVADLLLAMLHSESTLRSLIYPALAAVAAVLVNYGVADEHQLAALLGVVAAVLGGGVAARFTPRVTAETHPHPATPAG